MAVVIFGYEAQTDNLVALHTTLRKAKTSNLRAFWDEVSRDNREVAGGITRSSHP
jgi:hypothetical protein